jgi:hypothetical protein
MLDKLANLLFRCRHRHLSRPMAPARRPGAAAEAGKSESGGFVVCLDCGMRFSYDTRTLSMGKPIERQPPH